MEIHPQGTDDLRSRLIEIDKRLGKESLYYFAKKILGYSKMERKPHGDVCEYAQSILNTHRFGLDLEPRGTFKTTQFSQALPIFALQQNPDLRILLDSSVLQNSIDNLRVIKSHYEGNEKLRFLYGDNVGAYWVTEEITVKARKNPRLKEPSIRCASVDRVQVGPHYDIIIGDDLVTDLNCRTHEGRTNVINHIKLLMSLLEPNTGILIIVGTRWNYEDAYGWIIEHVPEFARRICRARDANHENLYFPQILTNQFLDSVEKFQGRDVYSSLYLNDPAPEDANSAFMRSNFKRFDKVPQNRHSFITIDPGGEKKGSDEWVIIGSHVDEENNKYLDRLLRGNWKMKEAWDRLFDLHESIQSIAVGLETTGGQKWLYEALVDEMRRRNKFINVVPLPHAVDSKEYRIKRLQGPYQCGAVFHSQEMGPLEDQLLRFPKGKDDIADCASMLLEISYPPRRMKPVKQAPKTTDEYLMRLFREQQNKPKQHSLLGDQY